MSRFGSHGAAVALALGMFGLGCAAHRPIEAEGLHVGEVALGKVIDPQERIVEAADVFEVDETVYARIRTEGTGTGVLRVRWIHGDQTTVGERTEVVRDADPVKVFTLDAKQPGDWKLEVYMNDIFVATERFEVDS